LLRRHRGTGLLPNQEDVFYEIRSPAWATASGFPYGVFFDDDGSGEAADIVAVGSAATGIYVDLFQVCGQSARSVRWINNASKLLAHLVKREQDAVLTAAGSRLIPARRLQTSVVVLVFRVFAVQPGLSKREVLTADNIAEILASEDTCLRQRAELGFPGNL
jgi:hypothetical protein